MSWLVALFARVALLVAWLSTPLVNRAFHGGWILPLLGIPILNLAAVSAIFEGNDFMEAVIAGVTTTAGWYTYINDVRGLASIVWLLAVGISMMRVKPKVAASTLRERELQEAG